MATATVYRTTSSLPSARSIALALAVFLALALVLAMVAILVLQNARWVDAQLDTHKATLQHPPEVMALMPLAPPSADSSGAAKPSSSASTGSRFRP